MSFFATNYPEEVFCPDNSNFSFTFGLHDGDRPGKLQPAPTIGAGHAAPHGDIHAARHVGGNAAYMVSVGKLDDATGT